MVCQLVYAERMMVLENPYFLTFIVIKICIIVNNWFRKNHQYILVVEIWWELVYVHGLPRWHSGKKSAWQCRRHKRHELNPWVRKIPVGNGNLFQYSYLENSRDRRAWGATLHGVSKSQTRLSDWALSTARRICS